MKLFPDMETTTRLRLEQRLTWASLASLFVAMVVLPIAWPNPTALTVALGLFLFFSAAAITLEETSP